MTNRDLTRETAINRAGAVDRVVQRLRDIQPTDPEDA